MKCVCVTFSNGETYAIPADVIAKDRATYYAEQEDTQEEYNEMFEQEFFETKEDRLELISWLNNTMDWSDVSGHAVLLETEEIDKASEFTNADKEVRHIGTEETED